MTNKPKKPPAGNDRRVFRMRAQEAYEILRRLITEHGGTDISNDLADKPMVEDVMRGKPEMVGALLRSAWQLRTNEVLAKYFQNTENAEEPVSEPEQKIGPCGRTFNDTVQSHLFGTARLYINRIENEWMEERLTDAKNLDKEFTPGIWNLFRRMVGMRPNVDTAALRNTYPRKGLYDKLKPFLLDEDQFKLVPAYAELSTKRADIIGELLANIRSLAAIRKACVLDPDTLMNARSCAIAYAESEISAEAAVEKTESEQKNNANVLPQDIEIAAKVRSRSAQVFVDVLKNHLESISFIAEHKAGAESVVKALAPHFAEETWAVLSDKGAVDNVTSCPSAVAEYLGRDSRHCSAKVSNYIAQLQYPEIARDIMKILRKEVGDDVFFRSLKEEKAIKVWESVPGIFSNAINYQHDAKGTDNTTKNFKDLQTSSLSVIENFKLALDVKVAKH